MHDTRKIQYTGQIPPLHALLTQAGWPAKQPCTTPLQVYPTPLIGAGGQAGNTWFGLDFGLDCLACTDDDEDGDDDDDDDDDKMAMVNEHKMAMVKRPPKHQATSCVDAQSKQQTVQSSRTHQTLQASQNLQAIDENIDKIV